MRKPKWQKNLTKDEIKHLSETCRTGKPNLASFKRNREWQIAENVECFHCESIARKLGMDVTLKK